MSVRCSLGFHGWSGQAVCSRCGQTRPRTPDALRDRLRFAMRRRDHAAVEEVLAEVERGEHEPVLGTALLEALLEKAIEEYWVDVAHDLLAAGVNDGELLARAVMFEDGDDMGMKCGRLQTIRVLGLAGASFDLPAPGGRGPWFLTASNGDEALSRRLSAAGAVSDRYTLLAWAVVAGDVPMALALMGGGARTDVYESTGTSLVLCAAIEGNPTMLEQLVDAGAVLDPTVERWLASPTSDPAQRERVEAAFARRTPASQA